MVEERCLPPGDVRRMEAATSMEHRALTEVLPVEMMIWRTTPPFYSQLGIKNHYSSLAHPQANRQVEVMKWSMLKIIKTQLEGAKGIWPEELPSILWAYKTTARTPTRKTPFRLTYGSEAVISTEVGLTSYKVHNHDKNKNDEAMRL